MFLLISLFYLRFDYTGSTKPFNLTAGIYTVHCYGARGGHSFESGHYEYGTFGGLGAYVNGTMKINGIVTFYANVGGEGSNGRIGPNAGGWNGGGSGGRDSKDHEDGPGGGGGSTYIRINNNLISSRIIVAAGGSGAVGVSGGANGGDLNGRYVDSNKNQQISFETTQTNGHMLLYGGGGESGKYHPGSGGGGGYYGGKGGAHMRMEYQTYAIGNSGSSYVSGQCGCSEHPDMKFIYGGMRAGGNRNQGNGYIIIEVNMLCSSNCYSCERNETCDVCMDGFILFKDKCYDKCPNGTFYSTEEKKCQYYPSTIFTKSNIFSNSNEFTKSNEFIKSNEFSKSNDFSKSNEFTKQNDFDSFSSFFLPTKLPTNGNFDLFHFKNNNNLSIGAIIGFLLVGICTFVILTIIIYMTGRRKRVSNF